MATVEQTAQALNITVRRVNQLAKENVLPREGRGDYNLGKCMAAYIRYLQAALAKKATMDESGEISSLQGNRQELLKIQIERERFEFAELKGRYIPIETHETVLADLVQETKARVRAVGSRVAADLVGETSRLMIQAKLDKAHDEALRQLATVVPRIPTAEAEDDQIVNDEEKTTTVRKVKNGKAGQSGKASRKAKAATAEG